MLGADPHISSKGKRQLNKCMLDIKSLPGMYSCETEASNDLETVSYGQASYGMDQAGLCAVEIVKKCHVVQNRDQSGPP